MKRISVVFGVIMVGLVLSLGVSSEASARATPAAAAVPMFSHCCVYAILMGEPPAFWCDCSLPPSIGQVGCVIRPTSFVTFGICTS